MSYLDASTVCSKFISPWEINIGAATAKSLRSCLTLCDPHRQQLTRLPCPWDSPGKNTGVGCHFLLQCMKVKSESEVAQSCPTLSDPMDWNLPGSSVHGIPQARVLEWGATAFSETLVHLGEFKRYIILCSLQSQASCLSTIRTNVSVCIFAVAPTYFSHHISLYPKRNLFSQPGWFPSCSSFILNTHWHAYLYPPTLHPPQSFTGLCNWAGPYGVFPRQIPSPYPLL